MLTRDGPPGLVRTFLMPPTLHFRIVGGLTQSFSNLPTAICLALPMKCLPLTFLHTIEVTRAMGIKYLWIDALCIVQAGPSSLQHWQAQSGQMGRIYANGLLNISRSIAKQTSDEGCFARRDCFVKTGLDTQVPLRLREVEAGTTYVAYNDAFSQEFGGSPLTQRAWVL